MPVFRIEKTKNYTIMANHHLQNINLSLKAKGLLSLMLSLPDDWEHSIIGYAKICRDGVDGITSAIKELEKNGYIIRKRIRNENGRFADIEYTILELPIKEKPILEKPVLDKPILENPRQYITKVQRTKELRTNDRLIDEYDETKKIVYENLEVEHFEKYSSFGVATRVVEMADLIIETLSSSKKHINIAGEDFPYELVKEKLLKLNSEHIKYVLECLDNKKNEIYNMKKYLLSSLFNAPSTMASFYTNKANNDFNTL